MKNIKNQNETKNTPCYYEMWAEMYRKSSAKERERSKKYWCEIHVANLKEKREDLIMFSSQILAMAVLVDYCESTKKELPFKEEL